MIVTGGIYRETCEVPYWNALLGSGGRAALAIANLSPRTELHTYAAGNTDNIANDLRAKGVEPFFSRSSTAIAFAYLHPLSRPVIAPSEIPQHAPITVVGKTVLRFGFLEGDAIVTAGRAVYDPQTAYRPRPFRLNGSQAEELAIVLNEAELYELGNSRTLAEAAHNIISSDQAKLVVVKRGIRGATVFSDDGSSSIIPAYRTSSIFKIGTGDIFSAAFSYYWAEASYPPQLAAELASRAVASYTRVSRLPIKPDDGADLPPVFPSKNGIVHLFGSSHALEDRWLLEEARWCIQDFGVEVRCPALDGKAISFQSKDDAILILGDCTSFLTDSDAATISSCALPVVIFLQDDLATGDSAFAADAVSDFTTAIYKVCWLATGSEKSPAPFSA